MAICNKCGAGVPDGQAFCSHCGQPIAATAPAPQQYQAPPAPPRVGGAAGMGLPAAIAALLTPMGLAPLVATLLCWIGWFLLPGVSVGISSFMLGSQSTSYTLWDALGITGSAMGGLGNGSAGFLGFIVVVCLLIPFGVPFVPMPFAKIARFAYGAPLLAFLVGWLSIEHTVSQVTSMLNSTLVGTGGAGFGINASWGVGTYLVVLASLAAAACIVLPMLMPKLAGTVAAPAARAAAQAPPAHAQPPAYAPPAQPAYRPPPPAYAPPAPPPAHVAPPAAPVANQATGFCTSCGAPRAHGSQFCTGCGARFAT